MGELWANIYSPKNYSAWPTKHCYCLGRSVILGYVNIENKANLIGFCYMHKQKKHLQSFVYIRVLIMPKWNTGNSYMKNQK